MTCALLKQKIQRQTFIYPLFASILFVINLPSLAMEQQHTTASTTFTSAENAARPPRERVMQKRTKTPSDRELYLQARSGSELNAHHSANHAQPLPTPAKSHYSPKHSIKSSDPIPSSTIGIPLANHKMDLIKKPAIPLPSDARITFEFQKAALSDVLHAFSAFTGTNLIISDRVQGTVSIRLENVPWREAFDTLLTTHGLGMQQRGNILWIAPAKDIAHQEKQRFQAQNLEIDAAPLNTSIFEMHYQRAEDVRTLLNGTNGETGSGMASERFLSKRGVAMADSRTNQLFVIDVPKRIEQIKHLLLAVDRPVPQVSIEAQIVEAEEGFSRSLGARLSLLGSGSHSPSPGEGADKGPGRGAPPSSALSHVLAGEKGALYDIPAAALSGFNPASLGFTLFGAGASHIIALELSMLEARGEGKILSSPRVVTADRVKALIEQGTELPYQAKVGNGVSGVQFRRAGLKLEVTPHIMPNGYVTLDVDVSKDSVGTETLSGPAINTKHIQTQVHVENAGTVAIGGIFTHDQRSDIVGLPWLSKLPIVGALFRRSIKNHRKNELLIFITPHVITPTQQ